jgi:hypothetical protein
MNVIDDTKFLCDPKSVAIAATTNHAASRQKMNEQSNDHNPD